MLVDGHLAGGWSSEWRLSKLTERVETIGFNFYNPCLSSLYLFSFTWTLTKRINSYNLPHTCNIDKPTASYLSSVKGTKGVPESSNVVLAGYPDNNRKCCLARIEWHRVESASIFSRNPLRVPWSIPGAVAIWRPKPPPVSWTSSLSSHTPIHQ